MIDKGEAENIIYRLKSCLEHDACEELNCEYFLHTNELKKLLEFVENAEFVVRCKDCKWLEDGSIRRCGMNNGKETFDIFYCFGGEKRE